MSKLLMPGEVDRILRYPMGRSQRLARRGKFPHVLLPDGSVRFKEEEIQKLIGGEASPPPSSKGLEVAHAG